MFMPIRLRLVTTIAATALCMGCSPSTTITPAKSEAVSRSYTVEASREAIPPAPPSPGSRVIEFIVEKPK